MSHFIDLVNGNYGINIKNPKELAAKAYNKCLTEVIHGDKTVKGLHMELSDGKVKIVSVLDFEEIDNYSDLNIYRVSKLDLGDESFSCDGACVVKQSDTEWFYEENVK